MGLGIGLRFLEHLPPRKLVQRFALGEKIKDLTRPNSPQRVLYVGNSPRSTASFRLVKYDDSPSLFLGVSVLFTRSVAVDLWKLGGSLAPVRCRLGKIEARFGGKPSNGLVGTLPYSPLIWGLCPLGCKCTNLIWGQKKKALKWVHPTPKWRAGIRCLFP